MMREGESDFLFEPTHRWEIPENLDSICTGRLPSLGRWNNVFLKSYSIITNYDVVRPTSTKVLLFASAESPQNAFALLSFNIVRLATKTKTLKESIQRSMDRNINTTLRQHGKQTAEKW